MSPRQLSLLAPVLASLAPLGLLTCKAGSVGEFIAPDQPTASDALGELEAARAELATARAELADTSAQLERVERARRVARWASKRERIRMLTAGR